MTLRHMKIFVSVFSHSSITKAAQELHLAQPSVSFSIRELEEYYGIHLFERLGRRIYPTEAGKEFYGYALHITSLFDDMEKKIINWDKLGTLRIGASITIGTHILPGIIVQCQKQFPDLTIFSSVNQSAAIEQQVLNNAVDIGLIENLPNHPDIWFEPFMKDSLCAIVPNQHPLAQKSKVTLAQMAVYPFLMREKGSAGREILESNFSYLQLSVHPTLESTSTQAIVKAVEEGIGVAILPYLLVKKDIESKSVKQLSLSTPLTRDFNIIYHRSKYLTSNMEFFMNLCKEKHFS